MGGSCSRLEAMVADKQLQCPQSLPAAKHTAGVAAVAA